MANQSPDNVARLVTLTSAAHRDKGTANKMGKFENIPEELRRLPLWLGYYLKPDKPGKKPRKVPFKKWANPADRAVNCKPLNELLAHPFAKTVGYQIYVDRGQPYVYIDIDNCRDPESGLVTEQANEIVKLLDTYTEVSSSGKGLRLVCRGKIARDHKIEGDPVEVYGGHISKIMAMTGDTVDTTLFRYAVIEDRQDELDQLMAQLQPQTAPKMTVTQALEEWAKENGDWKPERGYSVKKMSEVEMKKIEWLWHGRIPKGKLTIFAADVGMGKSIATCSIASIVTNGGTFPKDEKPCEPGEVLMLACEDDEEDTIAPRLAAAEARLDKITTITLKGDRQLDLFNDLQLLKQHLKDNPAIKLVIIDPITSYLGKANPFKDDEVRAVLIPLAALARDTGVTFLLVAHFNKRNDVNALGRILGASAFAGVCRSAWMFVEVENKETGETHNEMVRGKLNVGAPTRGIKYEIRAKKLPQLPADADPIGYVMWGELTDTKANEVLDGRRNGDSKLGRPPAKREQAKAILRSILADGAKPMSKVDEMMAAATISWRTVADAKKELKVISYLRDGESFWGMPQPVQEEKEVSS